MGQKDLENKSVEKFVNVFVNENIYEIATEYEEFKKDAVLNFKYYEDCATRITEEFFEQISNDKMKLGVYTTIMDFVQSNNEDLRDVEVRQHFIDNIGLRISRAYEILMDTQEGKLESVRFLLMHMILDMCFASVDEKEDGVSRLRLPAMFYDLMHKWNTNKELPKDFKDFRNFYGEAAEQDILNRTWENVKLYCEAKHDDPKEWSKRQFEQEKEYVQRFGKKLMQTVGSDDGTTWADMGQPKGTVRSESTAQPKGAVQSESTAQPENSLRSEGTTQSPYTMQQENIPDSGRQSWPGGKKKEDTYVDEAAGYLSRKKNKAEKSEDTIAPAYDSERNLKQSWKEDPKEKKNGFSWKYIMIAVIGGIVAAAIIIFGVLYYQNTMINSYGRERTKLSYTNTISAPLLFGNYADEETKKGDPGTSGIRPNR